jgi:hypothetical protein
VGAQAPAGQADAAHECHICMEGFCRGARIMSLPCEHRFCNGCIRRRALAAPALPTSLSAALVPARGVRATPRLALSTALGVSRLLAPAPSCVRLPKPPRSCGARTCACARAPAPTQTGLSARAAPQVALQPRHLPGVPLRVPGLADASGQVMRAARAGAGAPPGSLLSSGAQRRQRPRAACLMTCTAARRGGHARTLLGHMLAGRGRLRLHSSGRLTLDQDSSFLGWGALVLGGMMRAVDECRPGERRSITGPGRGPTGGRPPPAASPACLDVHEHKGAGRLVAHPATAEAPSRPRAALAAGARRR